MSSRNSGCSSRIGVEDAARVVLVTADDRSHVLTIEGPVDTWPDEELDAIVSSVREAG